MFFQKLFWKAPKLNSDPVLYDKSIQFWGDAIQWSNTDQFNDQKRRTFRVNGHKSRRPKIGDVMKAEMVNSFSYFIFTNVEYCNDPKDMFFADVTIYRQEPKDGSNAICGELPDFPEPKRSLFL